MCVESERGRESLRDKIQEGQLSRRAGALLKCGGLVTGEVTVAAEALFGVGD